MRQDLESVISDHDEFNIKERQRLQLEIGTLRSELYQLRGIKEGLLAENRNLKESLKMAGMK